jgi:hypothetical protein
LSPFNFVIITYNRPGDLLALAKENITDSMALQTLSLILNNASTEAMKLKNFIGHHRNPIRYLDAPSI